MSGAIQCRSDGLIVGGFILHRTKSQSIPSFVVIKLMSNYGRHGTGELFLWFAHAQDDDGGKRGDEIAVSQSHIHGAEESDVADVGGVGVGFEIVFALIAQFGLLGDLLGAEEGVAIAFLHGSPGTDPCFC